MTTKNDKIRLGETNFWQTWITKLLYTLISVKVWGLIAATWVSTYLLLHSVDPNLSINGAQWLTFNTTIWALIFGMKEIFRISEKRDKTETEQLATQMESKIKMSTIMANSKDKATKQNKFTPEGLEIVGDEPDAQS